MGLTLHIATEGLATPPTNDGSNPLAIGSVFHLGPDLNIFGVAFTSELRVVNLPDKFIGWRNPLLVEVANSDLEVVHGASDQHKNPHDLRIRIGGIYYKVPFEFAKRIKAKNGGVVVWQSTRHPLEADNEGRFRFWRHAPRVF